MRALEDISVCICAMVWEWACSPSISPQLPLQQGAEVGD